MSSTRSPLLLCALTLNANRLSTQRSIFTETHVDHVDFFSRQPGFLARACAGAYRSPVVQIDRWFPASKSCEFETMCSTPHQFRCGNPCEISSQQLRLTSREGTYATMLRCISEQVRLFVTISNACHTNGMKPLST